MILFSLLQFMYTKEEFSTLSLWQKFHYFALVYYVVQSKKRMTNTRLLKGDWVGPKGMVDVLKVAISHVKSSKELSKDDAYRQKHMTVFQMTQEKELYWLTFILRLIYKKDTEKNESFAKDDFYPKYFQNLKDWEDLPLVATLFSNYKINQYYSYMSMDVFKELLEKENSHYLLSDWVAQKSEKELNEIILYLLEGNSASDHKMLLMLLDKLSSHIRYRRFDDATKSALKAFFELQHDGLFKGMQLDKEYVEMFYTKEFISKHTTALESLSYENLLHLFASWNENHLDEETMEKLLFSISTSQDASKLFSFLTHERLLKWFPSSFSTVMYKLFDSMLLFQCASQYFGFVEKLVRDYLFEEEYNAIVSNELIEEMKTLVNKGVEYKIFPKDLRKYFDISPTKALDLIKKDIDGTYRHSSLSIYETFFKHLRRTDAKEIRDDLYLLLKDNLGEKKIQPSTGMMHHEKIKECIARNYVSPLQGKLLMSHINRWVKEELQSTYSDDVLNYIKTII